MSKCTGNNGSKAGTRGGSSYWTIYRQSKNVSASSNERNVRKTVVENEEEAEEVATLNKSDFKETDRGSEIELNRDPFNDSNDIFDNKYTISDEESEFDEENTYSRYDAHATQVFKGLILRHPHISNVFVDDMLRCLQSLQINVPKDHRTLLGTNQNPITLRKVEPGVYWHFGFRKLIDKLLENGIMVPSKLIILANVDGMPVANSSKANFWPILVSIYNFQVTKVFVIGIYFNEHSKPSDPRTFLSDYVEEVKILRTVGYKGIFIVKIIYPLDAPALAFVKDVQYHTGKSSCNKCTIVGEYKSSRVCFPSLYNISRTDSEFRTHLKYDKHHQSLEPGPLEIEELKTDLIKDFPIEPLHALYLGVMKKLILCWNGHLKYGFNTATCFKLKLKSDDISSIDNHLEVIKKYQPSDYNRPSRPISSLKYWKGAEFSCVLYCTGPVIFKNVLYKPAYDNFMFLHTASTIVSCRELKKLWPLARILFQKFVGTYKSLYGDYAMSYYIHNTLHITDDVINLNIPTGDYSVTSFESRLGLIGKLIRGGNKRLEQVRNRIEETIDYEIQSFKRELENCK